ncbi:MAG: cobalamin-dependent protein [Actinobacteria bacterium]|nr:cobalamin-dependent protein [Actinomycetota bacterium]MBU1944935.1 cobalamin-dependent protein [Actinomycetota bacterium]MBU2688139.1 cobalamin-dependent protein [Actinomycetota bacterium]
MRVALVNTNRYRQPPVVPVGLEYLVAPLRAAGHDVDACDLCWSTSPEEDLAGFIEESHPDVVGFTVRNIDTTLFHGNTFFLDDIRALVDAVRAVSGCPVVVGGAATGCAEESLADYLGADHVVVGPGEVAFPRLLESIAAGEAPRVVSGWAAGVIRDMIHPRGSLFDYAPYIESDDPVGLEFRKGCDWACPFCTERSHPVLERDVNAVVAEARLLADAGVRMFYFCDCEVNVDVEGTCRMLSALADADLGLEWSGYFRPAPFGGEVARLAAASGCSKLTVAAMSWEISAGNGAYTARDVESFVTTCREAGIAVAVDLLVGYPGEEESSVLRALELFAELRPATVGVGQFIRLYETTPFAGLARASGTGRFYGALQDNPGMIKPSFYTAIDREWLEDLLRRDPLFSIAGEQAGVNYQNT